MLSRRGAGPSAGGFQAAATAVGALGLAFSPTITLCFLRSLRGPGRARFPRLSGPRSSEPGIRLAAVAGHTGQGSPVPPPRSSICATDRVACPPPEFPRVFRLAGAAAVLRPCCSSAMPVLSGRRFSHLAHRFRPSATLAARDPGPGAALRPARGNVYACSVLTPAGARAIRLPPPNVSRISFAVPSVSSPVPRPRTYLCPAVDAIRAQLFASPKHHDAAVSSVLRDVGRRSDQLPVRVGGRLVGKALRRQQQRVLLPVSVRLGSSSARGGRCVPISADSGGSRRVRRRSWCGVPGEFQSMYGPVVIPAFRFPSSAVRNGVRVVLRFSSSALFVFRNPRTHQQPAEVAGRLRILQRPLMRLSRLWGLFRVAADRRAAGLARRKAAMCPTHDPRSGYYLLSVST